MPLRDGWTDADDAMFLQISRGAVAARELLEDVHDVRTTEFEQVMAGDIAAMVDSARAARGEVAGGGLSDEQLERWADMVRDAPTGAGGGLSGAELDRIAALAGEGGADA